MAKVVVIKFKKGCRPYFFQAGKLQLKRGQGVVVETSRGLEYAVVVEPEREVPDEAVVSPLKPVVRVATEKDEETVKRNEEKRPQAIETCKEKIRQRNLDMKLVDCEFTFDGSKVVFYFTSENRVDFRDLVKDLASTFHIRIELRQVGIRDETKLLGGIAPCGRECCCASCMSEFQKVSIKMAKNQGLSLNPGKISGLCGRLMCCLAYENEYYAEAYKKMPKIGGTVGTSEGNGTVVSTNMLKMEVRVKIEKDGALLYRDFPLADLVIRKGNEERTEKEEKSERPEKNERAERPERERQGGEKGEKNNKFDRHGKGEKGERKEKNRPERKKNREEDGKNS